MKPPLSPEFINHHVEVFFRDITSLGGLPVYLLALIASFLTGEHGFAWMLALSMAVMYAVASILRLAFFRQRPIRKKYTTWIEKIDAGSFPSMHANRVTLFVLLFFNSFRQPTLAILFSLLGIVICYSRVYLKKHYWYDVLWGIVLGIAEYFLVVWLTEPLGLFVP